MAHRIDRAQRVGELLLGFAGEADDEVARQRDIGARRADAVDHAHIAVARMLAVHRLQDAVAARLDGQMEERHQAFDIAVRVDQTLRHVVGMAGRIADAVKARNPVQLAD